MLRLGQRYEFGPCELVKEYTSAELSPTTPEVMSRNPCKRSKARETNTLAGIEVGV